MKCSLVGALVLLRGHTCVLQTLTNIALNFLFGVLVLQKYQHSGPDIFVSMSADATCRGLRSAQNGPLVISGEKGRYK